MWVAVSERGEPCITLVSRVPLLPGPLLGRRHTLHLLSSSPHSHPLFSLSVSCLVATGDRQCLSLPRCLLAEPRRALFSRSPCSHCSLCSLRFFPFSVIFVFPVLSFSMFSWFSLYSQILPFLRDLHVPCSLVLHVLTVLSVLSDSSFPQ